MDFSKMVAQQAEPYLKELFLKTNLFKTNNIKIIRREDCDDQLSKIYDQVCGVDYTVSTFDTSVNLGWRALRFWRTRYPDRYVYNSFSIRVKRNKLNSEEHCEANKRLTAIYNDTAFPQYMAQAHYDPDYGELLSLGLAKTKDIFECYDKGLFRECNKYAKNKDVYFRDVHWEVMKKHGYTVYEWYLDNSCKSKSA